ncbi:MAG: hypothetical protein RI920_1478, partial [Pseudomonadota bacterium]
LNLAYLLHEPKAAPVPAVTPAKGGTPDAADPATLQRIDGLIARLDGILEQDGHLI